MRIPIAGVLASTAFIAVIVLANYATTHFGFIPVGFGFVATAGTLFAGAALALRDVIQDSIGRLAVAVLITIGALLSLILASPAIAFASGIAFLVSEFVDFAVYTPIRRRSEFGDRRWGAAVLISGVAGAIIDTMIFIGIAFGTAAILSAIPGQLIGKLWANVALVIIGAVIARAVLRNAQRPANS